jgi:hypothetical protein
MFPCDFRPLLFLWIHISPSRDNKSLLCRELSFVAKSGKSKAKAKKRQRKEKEE